MIEETEEIRRHSTLILSGILFWKMPEVLLLDYPHYFVSNFRRSCRSDPFIFFKSSYGIVSDIQMAIMLYRS